MREDIVILIYDDGSSEATLQGGATYRDKVDRAVHRLCAGERWTEAYVIPASAYLHKVENDLQTTLRGQI